MLYHCSKSLFRTLCNTYDITNEAPIYLLVYNFNVPKFINLCDFD